MNILERKDLQGTNLQGTNLQGTDLIETKLEGSNLKRVNLERAHLEGARHLSLNQFSKVKTLHSAKLDTKFLIQLKEKYPAIFEIPHSDE